MNLIKSYPTNLLPNLSQTLPTVQLPIKGSNINSTSVRFNRSYFNDEVSCNRENTFSKMGIGVVFISGLIFSSYGKSFGL